MLQVGYSGLLGVGLPSALAGRTRAAEAGRERELLPHKPQQVLIVFLTGAASHHDTFDMKPDAPAEVRGEFNPIATPVPGLHVCEHLPRLAKRADKFAVVRSLSHGDNNHLMSTHYVLTGELQPGGFFDKVASRDDWPCYAAGCAYLRPRNDGIPSGVNLPTYLWQGALTWPGQHAGLVGPKYDPWQITGDPNKDDFRVDNLTLAAGLDVQRLDNRRSLVSDFNQQRDRLAQLAVAQRLTGEQDLAFSILTSSRFAEAFQLNREDAKMRDQYGRNTTGQSLLLARRLIEAGVPVVQTNIGAVQTWDNHSNIFPTLKDRLLPPLDQGVAALLDDLEARGLLEGTLVMMLGEFGRTPKINNNKGRDHWGPVNTMMFFGGGVKGGHIIGASDRIGALPTRDIVKPENFAATIYDALGIPSNAHWVDIEGRPHTIYRGKPIDALFG